MSKAEVATRSAADFAQAYQVILGEAELPELADAESMSRAIMERILEADSFEEAFAPQSVGGWRDHMGRAVLVQSFHLNRSTVEGDGGAPVYAVVDLVDAETGEAFTVTCGGKNVLMQLVKLEEKGWKDHPIELQERKTSEGYSVLWLVAAGSPF